MSDLTPNESTEVMFLLENNDDLALNAHDVSLLLKNDIIDVSNFTLLKNMSLKVAVIKPYLHYDFTDDPTDSASITNRGTILSAGDATISNAVVGDGGDYAGPTDGMIAWYKFDDTVVKNYSSVSGLDLVHSQLLRASLNSTQFKRGISSLSREAQTSDTINATTISGTILNNHFTDGELTVSFWLNIKDLSSTYANSGWTTAFMSGNGTADDIWIIFTSYVGLGGITGEEHLYIKFGNANYDFQQVHYSALGITRNGTMYDNFYHFTVVCKTDDFIKVYVNGIEKLSKTTGVSMRAINFESNTRIMSVQHTATRSPPALYDDFRIYNRALTVEEVKQVYGYTLTKSHGHTSNTHSYYWNGLTTDAGDNAYITLPKEAIDQIVASSQFTVSYWHKDDMKQGYIYYPFSLNTAGSSATLTNADISPIVSSTAMTVSFNANYDANDTTILNIDFDDSMSLSITKDDTSTSLTISEVGTGIVKYPRPPFFPYSAISADITHATVNINFPVFRAFDGVKNTLATSFITSGDYVLSSQEPVAERGFYRGTDNIEGYFGDWIKIDLHDLVVLQSYIIYPNHERIERSPRDFRVYGSLDNINWIQIDDRINIDAWGTTNNGIAITFDGFDTPQPFQYFGIVINKLQTGGSLNLGISFSEWELYGKPITSLTTTWTNSITPNETNHYAYTLGYDNEILSVNLYKNGIQLPKTGGSFIVSPFSFPSSVNSTGVIGDSTSSSFLADFNIFDNIVNFANPICSLQRASSLHENEEQGYIYHPFSLITAGSSATLLSTDIDPIVSSTAMTVSFNAHYDANDITILSIDFDATTSLSITKQGSESSLSIKQLDVLTQFPRNYFTSASTDITTSSILRSEFNPFRAFDGTLLTIASSWVSDSFFNPDHTGTNSLGGFSGEWIKIDLKELIILEGYKIYPSSQDNQDRLDRAPRDWRILGSKDNISWTEIDIRTGRTTSVAWGTVNNGLPEEYNSPADFTTPQQFQFFAIVVSGITGGANQTIISEWELYGRSITLRTTTWNNSVTPNETNHYAYTLGYDSFNTLLSVNLFKDAQILPKTGGSFIVSPFSFPSSIYSTGVIGDSQSASYLADFNIFDKIHPSLQDFNNYLKVIHSTNLIDISVSDSTTTFQSIIPNAIIPNTWTYYIHTLKYEAPTLTIDTYINYAKQAARTFYAPGFAFASTLPESLGYIGKSAGQVNDMSPGYLADFKMYSTALANNDLGLNVSTDFLQTRNVVINKDFIEIKSSVPGEIFDRKINLLVPRVISRTEILTVTKSQLMVPVLGNSIFLKILNVGTKKRQNMFVENIITGSYRFQETKSIGISNSIVMRNQVNATGGTITEANGYRIHTFKNTGASSFVVNNDGAGFDILVIGGGGGGSHDHGGGGGAGAVVALFGVNFPVGSHNVVVGAGGSGGTGSVKPGGKGVNSSLSTIIAEGGGGGGNPTASLANGGSGGGGDSYNPVVARGLANTAIISFNGSIGIKYGNDGGEHTPVSIAGSGGGGGGAGEPGEKPVSGQGTNSWAKGGDGIHEATNNGKTLDFNSAFDLSAESVGHLVGNYTYFGGGGGNGNWANNINTIGGAGGLGGGGQGGRKTLSTGNTGATDLRGTDGSPNTGGGGGGGGDFGGLGGAGGSGTVIIRYPIISLNISYDISDNTLLEIEESWY